MQFKGKFLDHSSLNSNIAGNWFQSISFGSGSIPHPQFLSIKQSYLLQCRYTRNSTTIPDNHEIGLSSFHEGVFPVSDQCRKGLSGLIAWFNEDARVIAIAHGVNSFNSHCNADIESINRRIFALFFVSPINWTLLEFLVSYFDFRGNIYSQNENLG